MALLTLLYIIEEELTHTPNDKSNIKPIRKQFELSWLPFAA